MTQTRVARLKAERRAARKKKAMKAGAAVSLAALALTVSAGAANAEPQGDATLLMPGTAGQQTAVDAGMTAEEYQDAMDTATASKEQGSIKSISISDEDDAYLRSLGYTIDFEKSLKESNTKDYDWAEMYGGTGRAPLRLFGSVDEDINYKIARSVVGNNRVIDLGNLSVLNDVKTGVETFNIAPKSFFTGVEDIKAGTVLPAGSIGPAQPKDFHSLYFTHNQPEVGYQWETPDVGEGDPANWIDMNREDYAVHIHPGIGFTTDSVETGDGDKNGTVVYDDYSNPTSKDRLDYLSKTGRDVPANMYSCYDNAECGFWLVPKVRAHSLIERGTEDNPLGTPGESADFAIGHPVWVSVVSTVSNGTAPKVGKENAVKTSNGGSLWFSEDEGAYADEAKTLKTSSPYWDNTQALKGNPLTKGEENSWKLWTTPTTVITGWGQDGPILKNTNGGVEATSNLVMKDADFLQINTDAPGGIKLQDGEDEDGNPTLAPDSIFQDGGMLDSTDTEGNTARLQVSTPDNGRTMLNLIGYERNGEFKGFNYEEGVDNPVKDFISPFGNTDPTDVAEAYGYEAHYEAPEQVEPPVEETPDPTPTPSPEPTTKPTDDPKPEQPKPPVKDEPQPVKEEQDKPTPEPTPTPSKPVKPITDPKPGTKATPEKPKPQPVKEEQTKEPQPVEHKDSPKHHTDDPKPQHHHQVIKKEGTKDEAINAGADEAIKAGLISVGILAIISILTFGLAFLANKRRVLVIKDEEPKK